MLLKLGCFANSPSIFLIIAGVLLAGFKHLNQI